MTTKELIAEINDLPVEQRIEIATQILEGLSSTDPEIEKAWTKEARRRLDDFEQGKTEAISGEQFDIEVQELKDRYSA